MEMQMSDWPVQDEYSVEALFHELFVPIASCLDILSVSRLLRVCSLLNTLSTSQRIWQVLVEQHYFESDKQVSKLPLTFDYIKYLRERIIWDYPLAWEKIEPSVHPSARSRHGATSVGDKLVIVGGHMKEVDFVRENDVWVFDSQSEAFEKIEPVAGFEPPKISRHALHTFGDKIYSFGGILQDKTKINTVSTFDLETKIWRDIAVKGTPPLPRCDPVTYAYKNGFIVFGGSLEGLVFPSDLHYFNIDTNEWTNIQTVNEAPESRIGCSAAIIKDKFYLYGGAFWEDKKSTYTKLFHEMWCLDLLTWEWSKLPSYGEAPNPHLNSVNWTSFVVENHIVIEGTLCSSSYVYDTISYTWKKLKSSTIPNNANFGSATLVNDTVYYLCGYRHNNRAKDVMKLNLSSTFGYIKKGIVPDSMKGVAKPNTIEEVTKVALAF